MKDVGPWHAWKILSNQTGLPSGCQVNIKCFYAKSARLGSSNNRNISSLVWPWCRRSFQDICRGLWIIIAELTCGLFPMIFRMVCPSCKHICEKTKENTYQTLQNTTLPGAGMCPVVIEGCIHMVYLRTSYSKLVFCMSLFWVKSILVLTSHPRL
jgi:hypothetical protein